MEISGYRIEKELAHGGMATVYLAVQESLDRHVALKVMAPALAADRNFGERFLREARTVARLHHPNILSVFDVGVEGHHYYLAMEYIPGGDLKQRIRQGAIPPQEALDITRQIAQALGYAHEAGFVHRDVKPENVLFRKDGTPVLADFGIAKAVGSGTKMTGTGMSIGTPHYMSPEQAQGESNLDGRSDLYSLGVVLYEMLTGNVPFDADNTIGIAMKHVSAPLPQLPREVVKLQPLLDRLLGKNPQDRYQSAAKLVQEIDAALAGKLPEVAPQSVPKTQVMKAEKTKAPASEPGKGSGLKWLAGGALLAVVVAGGLFAMNGSKKLPVLSRGGGTTSPAPIQAVAPTPKILAKGDAILQVTSEPSGATVLLDGIELGQTPLTRSDLPAGQHNLSLQLKNYQPYRDAAKLGSAEVLKKQIVLQRGEGKITILSEPFGAVVSLDGKTQKEKTPLTLITSAGQHAIKLHLDKYYDKEQAIEVAHGETAKLEIELQGGHLVQYQGKWREPAEVEQLKAEAARLAAAEQERQRQIEEQRRVAEQKRLAEEAKQREEERRLAEEKKQRDVKAAEEYREKLRRDYKQVSLVDVKSGTRIKCLACGYEFQHKYRTGWFDKPPTRVKCPACGYEQSKVEVRKSTR